MYIIGCFVGNIQRTKMRAVLGDAKFIFWIILLNHTDHNLIWVPGTFKNGFECLTTSNAIWIDQNTQKKEPLYELVLLVLVTQVCAQ